MLNVYSSYCLHTNKWRGDGGQLDALEVETEKDQECIIDTTLVFIFSNPMGHEYFQTLTETEFSERHACNAPLVHSFQVGRGISILYYDEQSCSVIIFHHIKPAYAISSFIL